MATVAQHLKNIATSLRARLDSINASLTAKGQTAADTYDDVPALIDAISTGSNVTGVTATADKVLDGSVFVDSTGAEVEGTMPNNGAIDETMDGIDKKTVSIPRGYTSGGTVSLTDDIDNIADEQTDLISQIQTALEGKAAGGGEGGEVRVEDISDVTYGCTGANSVYTVTFGNIPTDGLVGLYVYRQPSGVTTLIQSADSSAPMHLNGLYFDFVNGDIKYETGSYFSAFTGYILNQGSTTFGYSATSISFSSTVDLSSIPTTAWKAKAIYGVVGESGGGITPSGTIEITENGTHDVTNYASALVNVASSGGSSVVRSTTGMPIVHDVTAKTITITGVETSGLTHLFLDLFYPPFGVYMSGEATATKMYLGNIDLDIANGIVDWTTVSHYAKSSSSSYSTQAAYVRGVSATITVDQSSDTITVDYSAVATTFAGAYPESGSHWYYTAIYES